MKRYFIIGYFLFLVIYPTLLLILTLNLDQDIDTGGWVFIGTMLVCSYAAAVVVYYSTIKGKGLFKRKPKPTYIKIIQDSSDNQPMILVPANEYLKLIIIAIHDEETTTKVRNNNYMIGLHKANAIVCEIINDYQS